MKEYREPFAAGHLKSGGSVEVTPQKFKCGLCGEIFENLNPNSLVCEKCRPEARKIGQRKIAERKKRKRLAAKAK